MMLGGLAAVSLLVAALNIANTMTMAIYERTKRDRRDEGARLQAFEDTPDVPH